MAVDDGYPACCDVTSMAISFPKIIKNFKVQEQKLFVEVNQIWDGVNPEFLQKY